MGRTTVDVRSAVAGDVDLLLQLTSAARAEAGHDPRTVPPGHRTRTLAALERPDVEVLVAEAGHEPVGLLVLRRDELLPLCGADAVHVEQLWVHPMWRRRGVARSLLRAAATVGEHAGLENVVCSAPSGDRDAARFLTRLGFTPLVTHRVSSVVGLLRRLAGEGAGDVRRSALEQTLARRRREHAKLQAATAVMQVGPPAS